MLPEGALVGVGGFAAIKLVRTVRRRCDDPADGVRTAFVASLQRSGQLLIGQSGFRDG